MLALETLLRYIPSSHGEHGVDSTLHMLARRSDKYHEVFSNPPGGSWTAFDIARPESAQIFRWDHMPRVPGAKRPDFVLQFNSDDIMNFILIESKQKKQDIYENMGLYLTQFFVGTTKFLGLKNRPAWHEKEITKEIWELITPEDNYDKRYWFKDIPDKKVNYWPAFAYAFSPEYTAKTNIDEKKLEAELEELVNNNKDIHISIGIGWTGEHHYPFAMRYYSKRFSEISLAQKIDDFLEPVLLQK